MCRAARENIVDRAALTPDQSFDTMAGLSGTLDPSSTSFKPLSVNGTELAYREYGSGPTIVVSAQQDFTFDGYLDLLVQAPMNYHVFAIRLRRLRKQDEAPGEDVRPRWYARWGEDVYAAVQALGLSRFIYTGVSHGAVIGWQLAVDQPELLRALVAIVGVPHARSRSIAAPRGRASQMAARADPATLRANVERLFGPARDPQRAERRDALIAARIERILTTPAEEAAVSLGVGFPDVESDEQLDQLLGRIRIPALTIAGLHDPWVRPDALLRTTQVVPGSKLVVFEDESHLVALESPFRVADEIRLFVDRLPAQSEEPGAAG